MNILLTFSTLLLPSIFLQHITLFVSFKLRLCHSSRPKKALFLSTHFASRVEENKRKTPCVFKKKYTFVFILFCFVRIFSRVLFGFLFSFKISFAVLNLTNHKFINSNTLSDCIYNSSKKGCIWISKQYWEMIHIIVNILQNDL